MDNLDINNCNQLLELAKEYNRMVSWAMFLLGTFAGFFLWTLYDRFGKKTI